jgi:hypothetical protein
MLPLAKTNSKTNHDAGTKNKKNKIIDPGNG